MAIGTKSETSKTPFLEGGLDTSLEGLALEPNASKLFGTNGKSVEGTNGRKSGVGYVRFVSIPPSTRSNVAAETMTADCSAS
jgi:hypothetical protein